VGNEHLQRWFREINRRRVMRVAAIYVAAAWAIMQFSDIALPALGLPETAVRFVLLALALGLPVALVFGWRYDLTSDGIRRTASASEAELQANARLGPVDYVVLLALFGFMAAIVFNAGRTLFDVSRNASPASSTPASQAPSNSVAVLPFTILTGSDDQRHLGEGLAEDVLNRLATHRVLQVLARTSSFAFAQTDRPPRDLAALFGVRYLLQGTLEIRDGNARVQATLVDEQGFQRWGSEFSQPLSAISTLESSIADAVASAIQGTAATTSQGAGGPRGTQSPRAWQSYLLAREFMQKRPPGWTQSALRELEASVEADAGFAEAQAAYAVALALTASNSVDRRELFDRATSAANRAQVLAPDSAAVLAARGLLLQMQQPPDLATSELVLRRAVEIDPANVDARNWLQTALSQMGRVAEAQQVLLATAEIDPLNPVVQINVAGRYAAQGDYASARNALDRLLDLPQQPNYLRYHFEALDADFGRLDESLGWTLSEFEAHPNAVRNANVVERFAVSLGRLGLFGEAERVMTVAMRLGPDNASVFAGRSMLYIMQGRFRELDEHQRRYIAATGVNLRDLPRWMTFALGAGHAICGEGAQAIELLEPVMERKPDFRLIDSQNDLSLEFRQLLAYAYQGVGRSADAEDQLSAIDQALQSTHDQGFARSPGTLARWAVNDAMRGRTAEGLARLQQAYDAGWRDVSMIRHDPRWARFANEPAYQALIQRADAEITALHPRAQEMLRTAGMPGKLDG
jgi:TolB-like protein/tetratricopeptide (TPR) repeat protein